MKKIYYLLVCMLLPLAVYADFESECMESLGIAILVLLGWPIVIGFIFGCICAGIRILRGFFNI